jgi:hypothetical protein
MKLPPWLAHTLRIAFAVLVIAVLVRSGALKPALLGAAVARHPALYAFAFFLYLVPLQILAWGRWHLLLRAAKVQITWRESARLHLTGIFFNGFLPGGTGGDLVKGWYLVRGRNRTEAAAAVGTLVVDRITGLFGLIILAAAANWISRDIWSTSCSPPCFCPRGNPASPSPAKRESASNPKRIWGWEHPCPVLPRGGFWRSSPWRSDPSANSPGCFWAPSASR